MNYCIVKDDIIQNMIVCINDHIAEKFGAVPSYEGAKIGDTYAPPGPTPSALREEAYNTEKVITWDGRALTVTDASALWQYYAAEGSEKADELQALIAAAKAEIRERFPDEGGDDV